MKSLAGIFGAGRKKEDGIRSEISYVDLSAIESDLGHYVPKSRKRVDFNHHDNLNFQKVIQDQQTLKKEFEDHGGSFADKQYAVFNDSTEFNSFNERLMSFFELFDLDPKPSSNKDNHYLIMISNHQGFEGQDILSLSEEKLRQALKAPFIMEDDGQETSDDNTDVETISDVDEANSISSSNINQADSESILSADIGDVDPRIGCYLIDDINLNKQLEKIIETRPNSKEEIKMFRELIEKARENALRVAQQIKEQEELEEQIAQRQEELEILERAALLEKEEEKREFEQYCEKYHVQDCVQKVEMGPMTKAVLESEALRNSTSQGMGR